jgi:hypothetical protein
MKSIFKATLVTLLALSLSAQVYAQTPCTPQTCAPGPVYAYFPSDDCSDEPTFYQISVYPECTNQQITTIHNDKITQHYYDSMACDESYGFWEETSYFGKCAYVNHKKRENSHARQHERRGHSESEQSWSDLARQTRMVLANVNDSYASPQQTFQFDETVLMQEGDWSVCSSPNNCTLPDGSPALYYENYYHGENCTDLRYSEMQTKFQPGNCYNSYNSSYILYNCISANMFQKTLFNAPCRGSPFYTEIVKAACGPASYYSGFCSGAFEPVIDSPVPTDNGNEPSGTAASLTASAGVAVLLGFMALLAM